MLQMTNTSVDPHFNMAFDDFCLEQLRTEEPMFYLWRNKPSVIVGLNQNVYSEVNLPYLSAKGIVLARRVTGGGAVYHDLQNLNYTIVGRSSDLDRDYPEYTGMIASALRELGADVEITGRNDILLDGRKVSGFAKRVWKDRLMVHGTLMFDVDIDTLAQVLDTDGSKVKAAGIGSVHSRVANLKDYLPGIKDITELQEKLGDILRGPDRVISLSDEQTAQVRRMSEEKFATWQWNYAHSPKAEFLRKGKFGCGTVEACFCVEDGLVKGLHFAGDFLGNLPVERLENVLEGVRFDMQHISPVLAGERVSDYFDGMQATDLASLITQG